MTFIKSYQQFLEFKDATGNCYLSVLELNLLTQSPVTGSFSSMISSSNTDLYVVLQTE